MANIPKSKQNSHSANPSNPTKASRDEIRTKTIRFNPARASAKPVERSGQKRSHS